jgi:hypothetical protein
MVLRLRSDEGVSNIFWEDAISILWDSGLGGIGLELDWSGLGDGGSDGGAVLQLGGCRPPRDPPLACPPFGRVRVAKMFYGLE